MSSFFYYGGVFYFLRTVNNLLGRKLTIITYHRVTEKRLKEIRASLPFLFTRKDSFEEHIKFLKSHYSIISFKNLIHYLRDKTLPKNSLIITFDDGYEDFYRDAYPVLKKFKVKAVIFLTVNMINKESKSCFWWDRAYYYFKRLSDTENCAIEDHAIQQMVKKFSDDPSRLFQELNQLETEDIIKLLNSIKDSFKISDEEIYAENKMLNWNQINKMKDLIEIGSHTCNHRNMLRLTEEEMSRELLTSKEIIREQTGSEPIAFSYPHGNVNQVMEKKLKESGYLFAVTTQKGINQIQNNYLLKRINVWELTGSINDTFCKYFFAMNLMWV